MAVIWEKSFQDSSYKITKAGNAVRLYRNHVLHSQWNPTSPVTGKIWDIFLLSTIGQNLKIKNALVLGAGGGSVINLIHHFYPEAKVDAIDLDRMQLYIAKRFFKVSANKTQLINEDVFEWIKHNKKKYDLIIDDVFRETDNIPYRSIAVKKSWTLKLLGKLTGNGNLVINFADQKEWKQSYKHIESICAQKKYNIGVGIQNSCDNRIVFISKFALATHKIKHEMKTINANDYLKQWGNGTFSYRKILGE